MTSYHLQGESKKKDFAPNEKCFILGVAVLLCAVMTGVNYGKAKKQMINAPARVYFDCLITRGAFGFGTSESPNR